MSKKKKEPRTLLDFFKQEIKKGYNYPSIKLVSDGDVINHLTKIVPNGLDYIQAFKVVKKELKKDKGLRDAWQSSIAVMVSDEVARMKRTSGKKVLSQTELHRAYNNAASNFIEILIK